MAKVRDMWERMWRGLPPDIAAGPLSSPRRPVPAQKTYDFFIVLFPGLPSALRSRRALAVNASLTSADVAAFREATADYVEILTQATRLASALLDLIEEYRTHPTVRNRTNARNKAGARGEAVTLTQQVWKGPRPLPDPEDTDALRAWVMGYYGLDAQADPTTVPMSYPWLYSWAALPEVRAHFQHELDDAWAWVDHRRGEPLGELAVLAASPVALDRSEGEAELPSQLKAAADILEATDSHSVERYLSLRAAPKDPTAAITAPRFMEHAVSGGRPRPLDETVVRRLNGPLTQTEKGVTATRVDDLVRWEIGQACSPLGLSRPIDRQLLVVGCSMMQFPIDLERTVAPTTAAPASGSPLHDIHRRIAESFFGGQTPWKLPRAARRMLNNPLPTFATALWNRLHNNAAAGAEEQPWPTLNRAFTTWIGGYAQRSSTSTEKTAAPAVERLIDIDLRQSTDRPGAPDLFSTVAQVLVQVATQVTDGRAIVRAFLHTALATPKKAAQSPEWRALEARAQQVDPESEGVFTAAAVADIATWLSREHPNMLKHDEKD